MNTVNAVQLSMRFDLSVEDFYSKNGSTQLIYNVAAVLGISPDQIRITNVVKGSTVILMHILENSPTSSDSTNTKSLNLTQAVATIVTKISTGDIVLPASLLNFTFNVVKGDEELVTNSTDSNITIVLDNQILDLIVNITNNTATNSTNNNTNNNGTIDNGDDIDHDQHNLDEEKEDRNRRNRIYIIVFIVVPVGLILIGLVIYFMIRHNNKKNATPLVQVAQTDELSKKEIVKVDAQSLYNQNDAPHHNLEITPKVIKPESTNRYNNPEGVASAANLQEDHHMLNDRGIDISQELVLNLRNDA
jgi:hypothetical protein